MERVNKGADISSLAGQRVDAEDLDDAFHEVGQRQLKQLRLAADKFFCWQQSADVIVLVEQRLVVVRVLYYILLIGSGKTCQGDFVVGAYQMAQGVDDHADAYRRINPEGLVRDEG